MDVLKIVQQFLGIDFALLDIVADPDEELYNIVENLHHAREENLIQMSGFDDSVPFDVVELY